MTQYIEIENGLVSVIDRTVRISVPLDEWLPRIERRTPQYMPLLPTGTRAVWWDPTDLSAQKLMLLMEREPQTITLNLDSHLHRIMIPWTRFFFYATTRNPDENLAWRLEDYRIFWAKSRHTGDALADMTPAIVPNVYQDGRICFGSTGAAADQSLADRIDQTINEFYVSTFNRDLAIRYPNGWRNYATWERTTAADPLGWLSWPDLDPQSNRTRMYSFNDMTSQWIAGAARNAPVVVQDGIPDLPMGATFGRINQWLAGLTSGQRLRVATAVGLAVAHAPETFAPDPEEPEDV